MRDLQADVHGRLPTSPAAVAAGAAGGAIAAGAALQRIPNLCRPRDWHRRRPAGSSRGKISSTRCFDELYRAQGQPVNLLPLGSQDMQDADQEGANAPWWLTAVLVFMLLLLLRHVTDALAEPNRQAGDPNDMVTSPEFSGTGITFSWGTVNVSGVETPAWQVDKTSQGSISAFTSGDTPPSVHPACFRTGLST